MKKLTVILLILGVLLIAVGVVGSYATASDYQAQREAYIEANGDDNGFMESSRRFEQGFMNPNRMSDGFNCWDEEYEKDKDLESEKNTN